MAKRTAGSDLNHDNWDREDEPEEAGTFAKASDDALKKRVIKVAKRRNPIATLQQSEENKSSAFGGFTGFGKTPSSSSSSTSSNFGFLSNVTSKTEPPKTNGTAEPEDNSDKKLDEYYAKLKGLNESVAEWIKKHVATNPFINLQPIFKDYDKYINDLEKMKSEVILEKVEKSSASSTQQMSYGTTLTNSFPKFSFGTTSSASGPGFSLSSSYSTTATMGSTSTVSNSFTSKPTFSFGSTTSSDTGKFSFTSTVIKPADPPKEENQEDDEDEPPKVEITPVVEEGHVYSVRCKVFVKKDGNFADHGVGTLYLKPIPDSEKVQLIVRAETNLGRLICNFILSESIPMQRMGKKDVMLVCIPNPETKPPPVPILLRVKSPEDADDLLKTLQKHKK